MRSRAIEPLQEEAKKKRRTGRPPEGLKMDGKPRSTRSTERLRVTGQALQGLAEGKPLSMVATELGYSAPSTVARIRDSTDARRIIDEAAMILLNEAPNLAHRIVELCYSEDQKSAIRALELATRIVGLGPMGAEPRAIREVFEAGAQAATEITKETLASLREFIRWKTSTQPLENERQTVNILESLVEANDKK